MGLTGIHCPTLLPSSFAPLSRLHGLHDPVIFGFEFAASRACSIVDQVGYEPDTNLFMVLDHIEQARARSLPYLYLGYWIEGCRKMTYKARFEPLEARTPQGWVPLKRP